MHTLYMHICVATITSCDYNYCFVPDPNGAAAGATIGALLALGVVAVLVVLLVVGVIKYREHIRRQRQ